MSAKTAVRIQLTRFMSQLYGYIFCMLVSNSLVGMPLFGGALYLCGRAVSVYGFIYSKKNRKYLPSYTHRWGILLGGALLVIVVVLAGLYPATFQSPKVWNMFAITALCLCADGMAGRIRQLKQPGRKASRTEWVMTFLLQALIVGGAAWIFFVNLERKSAIALTAGFALLVLIRAYTAWKMYAGDDGKAERDAGDDTAKGEDIRNIRAYHTFEWISLLLVAALELTVAVIYALLATDTERMLPAIGIGIGCTLVFCEASLFYLRRSKKPKRQDPTWLLIAGLVFWLCGVLLCSRIIWYDGIDWIRIYICLGLISAGSTLSLNGLVRIEEVMTRVAELSGNTDEVKYRKLREMNWELALLLGDVLAMIALSIFCYLNGKAVPDMTELMAHYQPVMLVPVALIVIAALVSAYLFPLSARYIEKTKRLVRMKRDGIENPALEKQVDHVIRGEYHQPWLTRALILILKIIYRNKVVDADHIIEEEGNPIVFLCNHGEINGPIVCKMYIPVPIRVWTISKMMFDEDKVTAYLYENTYSKKTFLPVFVRKMLARLIGWLSVRVMSEIESIPVYRDSPMKLRETVRMSIEAMEAGDNLLIFPENPESKYPLEGIGRIAPGFLMLAEAYWKKCDKKLRMLPTYANRTNRTLTFGQIITYEPDNGFKNEQQRIVEETRKQILAMAGMTESEEG